MAAAGTWKSASVVTSATPQRVWSVYQALRWQEWDHDIASMCPVAGGASEGLVDGSSVQITMAKDGKTHTATIFDVHEARCFSYRAPLPGGCQMIAVHTLEPVGGADDGADGGGGAVSTRITHTFQFSGMLAGLFRWMTANYVQNGLDTNTVALKALAERD